MKVNENIIFYPDGNIADLYEPFRRDLETALKQVEEISSKIYIYLIKNYLNYLPAGKEEVTFQNFDPLQNSEKEAAVFHDFMKKMRDIDKRWRASSDGHKKHNLKIAVFMGFPDRESVEKNLKKKNTAGYKRDDDTPALNILPMEPKYNFNQMVLNKTVKSSLESCMSMIKNMDKIYKEWGFEEIDPVQKSVLNFFGPPGTGKTMAAHAIAAELGRKILAVNYAEIESKFVGEAPKNLISAFEIAKKESCVLFFDEADSFLGKRITSVSSSSDQAVNSLRSQMLILLETFDITVIFATNLNENYDKAFDSRILCSIKFELPDRELRKQSIAKMIPSKAPINREILTDELLYKLSDLTEGFSHRELKNAALMVLTECCKRNSEITEDLLVDVFTLKKKEFEEKNEKEARKRKLGSEISEKIKNGDYAVKKIEDSESTDNPESQANSNEEKTEDKKEE